MRFFTEEIAREQKMAMCPRDILSLLRATSEKGSAMPSERAAVAEEKKKNSPRGNKRQKKEVRTSGIQRVMGRGASAASAAK